MVSLALGKLRQEDYYKFKVILCCRVEATAFNVL